MENQSNELKHVNNFVKLSDERSVCVNDGDSKIWFFGQKFLDQPTFNFGHFVTFAGAHSIFYDTKYNEFDRRGARPFSSVSSEENLAEVVFAFQSRIYLLLYVHFGGFRVTSLHVFNDNSGEWEKFANVQTTAENEVHSENEKAFKQTLILVDGESAEGIYFVSFVDHQIRVHLLRISKTQCLASWEIAGEVPDETNVMKIQPTAAVLLNDNIFIQGGVHGCGFRYQPLALLQLNLNNKSAAFNEMASDENKPSFTFSGAEGHAILQSSQAWVHVAGRNASGMTHSIFNGQIWAIQNLGSNQPTWKKLELEVPDPKGDEIHVVAKGRTGHLFVFSNHLGVLKGQIEV